MKIGAAGLLIAISVFLQESKCMHNGAETSTAAAADTILLTTDRGLKLTGILTPVKHVPFWLKNRPTADFQHYDVHLQTTWGELYNTRIEHELQSRGRNQGSVEVTLGQEKYFSIEGGFQPYRYEESVIRYAVDRVYITVPRTRDVVYVLLQTEFSAHTPWPWSRK